jgi:hypothetical protein
MPFGIRDPPYYLPASSLQPGSFRPKSSLKRNHSFSRIYFLPSPCRPFISLDPQSSNCQEDEKGKSILSFHARGAVAMLWRRRIGRPRDRPRPESNRCLFSVARWAFSGVQWMFSEPSVGFSAPSVHYQRWISNGRKRPRTAARLEGGYEYIHHRTQFHLKNKHRLQTPPPVAGGPGELIK